MLAVALVATAACGTRLPDTAFVNTGANGGTGTATGTRSGTGTGTGAGAGTGTGSNSSGTGTGAGGTGAGTGPGGAAGGGGADGPNQASDVGVTENEILIGNITAINGILGDAFAPPLRGLQAYVQWINDHGGIHGRTLRLESCDDGESRQKNLECAQDLVANNTRSEGGSVPYINGKGVPIFFGLPISNAASRFPHYWSIYGNHCPRDGDTVCYNDEIYSTSGIYRWFKEHTGVKKAGVFFYGLINISKDAGQFVMDGLESEGFEVTPYDVNFTNPNFDQYVDDMKAKGIDIILDVIDDGTNRKLCDAMQRKGVSVTAKVSTVVSYGDEIGTDFAPICRPTIYITGNTMSYSNRSNPAVDEFRAAFDTYQPGTPLHQWSLEGWMAGKSLTEALNTMGAAPTRQGLEDWLRGLNNYTANGLSIPIDFIVKNYPSEEFADADCTAIAKWSDDTQGWIQQTGPAGDCYDHTHQYATKASDRGD
jgi:ABC-type branched-subunit amino acid transport system substrate-binding protein